MPVKFFPCPHLLIFLFLSPLTNIVYVSTLKSLTCLCYYSNYKKLFEKFQFLCLFIKRSYLLTLCAIVRLHKRHKSVSEIFIFIGSFTTSYLLKFKNNSQLFTMISVVTYCLPINTSLYARSYARVYRLPLSLSVHWNVRYDFRIRQ